MSKRFCAAGTNGRLDLSLTWRVYEGPLSEWKKHKWKADYCDNSSKLRVFVPRTGARPVGMGLPRAAWVKLNRLRTGVRRFSLSMHKWGLAPSPNCECGAPEQTADHVLTACPIHRAPHRARGLTVLHEQTRC